MKMSYEKQVGNDFLKEAIGINLEVLSNEYNELTHIKDTHNTSHTIVIQIKEEEPDYFAFSILFTLSVLSFIFASPRGYSVVEYDPDKDWSLGLFIKNLNYEKGNLFFSADYVEGRMMKTDITYEKAGKITITAINRGKVANTWILMLQGKQYLEVVDNGGKNKKGK